MKMSNEYYTGPGCGLMKQFIEIEKHPEKYPYTNISVDEMIKKAKERIKKNKIIMENLISYNDNVISEENTCFLDEKISFIRYKFDINELIITPPKGKIPEIRNIINTGEKLIIEWKDNDYQPITITKNE